MANEVSPMVNNAGNAIRIPRGADWRYNELKIRFKRTVRVANNEEPNALPPDLGNFPVYQASQYKEKLPGHIGEDEFFLPMYQREAMWISFTSARKPFAIKIYVGGINAISGEPTREDIATMLRRTKLLDQKKCIQDYVVVPGQEWVDGIAAGDGHVRQFVAMLLGTGYSVEYQVTGEDLLGGIQFELTPLKELPRHQYTDDGARFYVYVRRDTGHEHVFIASKETTIRKLSQAIVATSNLPPKPYRFQYGDYSPVYEDQTLEQIEFEPGDTLEMLTEQIGGGYRHPRADMCIAPGGLIKQSIYRDDHNPRLWDVDSTIRFNVNILSSEKFKEITGIDPPNTPITAETYEEYGFPYSAYYDEEPTGIAGQFDGVKSVNELDEADTASLSKSEGVKEMKDAANHKIVTLSHTGKPVGFRSVSELEKQVRELQNAGASSVAGTTRDPESQAVLPSQNANSSPE